ncbi:ATP-binding protein [Fulvivirga sp. 29W222]|uniref:ATP-binding protein n=1 Tax=Fulvivirga marina TaxID=2494733 RepID=A0A937KFR0_9BACT|nr:ATP-binding protein [Fulvivirga marina]MBL6448550.1 ATP-binding protein [Fulvivirga marina]
MAKNYGKSDIMNWKFDELEMPQEWADHLGTVCENFRMLIEGPSGHGKTEYVMKLAKMLATHYGKVNFNSTEQGKSSTFQIAYKRNKMYEIKGSKFMLAEKSQKVFEPYFKKVQKPNSGRVLIIDSLDYMKLTFDQFKQLHERFPHKAIIITCWNDPMDTHAKKIKYCCDIKVSVKDFKAAIRSRFGGNKPFIIWDQRSRMSTQLQMSLS